MRQKLGLNRKKKHGVVAFAGTDRVQKLRVEYWEKMKNIETENLVFLSGNGDYALARAIAHARSQIGTRVGGIKPFYRGALSHSYWRN